MKYTEYAFKQWASCPKTYHPKDMERFYIFVKTANRYGSKRYLEYKYFKNELIKYCGLYKLDEKEIRNFHKKYLELSEYEKYRSLNIYDFAIGSR